MVAYCFAEKSLCLVSYGGSEILRIIGIDEFHRDAQLGQDVIELRVGTTIEIVGRHDLITSFRQVNNGVKHTTRARCDTKARGSSFQCGDSLLQHVGGGIHQAGIYVT